MIAAGVWHLRRAALGESVGVSAEQWAGIMVGAAVIVVSFSMDLRNLMKGGMPQPLKWACSRPGS
jgi:hypothetical protein